MGYAWAGQTVSRRACWGAGPSNLIRELLGRGGPVPCAEGSAAAAGTSSGEAGCIAMERVRKHGGSSAGAEARLGVVEETGNIVVVVEHAAVTGRNAPAGGYGTGMSGRMVRCSHAAARRCGKTRPSATLNDDRSAADVCCHCLIFASPGDHSRNHVLVSHGRDFCPSPGLGRCQLPAGDPCCSTRGGPCTKERTRLMNHGWYLARQAWEGRRV